MIGLTLGGTAGSALGGHNGGTLGVAPSKRYALELEDASGATRQVTSIYDRDINLEHTAVSDWSVTVPADRSLDEWVFSQATITYDGEQLISGELRETETRRSAGETTLTGVGVLGDLTDLGGGALTAPVTFSERHYFTAIQQFLDEYTEYDADVTRPTALDGPAHTETAQAAETTDEFYDVFSILPTQPFEIRDDALRAQQSLYWLEAEETDYGGNQRPESVSGSLLSGGQGLRFDGESQYGNAEMAGYRVTTDYQIPDGEARLSLRVSDPDDNLTPSDLTVRIDGNEVTQDTTNTVETPGYVHSDISGSLEAEEHEIEIEWPEGLNTPWRLDALLLWDDRFYYEGDFNDYAFDSGSKALAGPPLYPTATIRGRTGKVGSASDSATLETRMNDTSGDQALTLDLFIGTTEQNSETVTDIGGSTPRAPRGSVTMAPWGTQSKTPTQGHRGQALYEWRMEVETTGVPAIVEETTYEGSKLEVLRKLHEEAGMRLAPDHGSADVLRVESFMPADNRNDREWTSYDDTRKTSGDGYANRVTIIGGPDGEGGRYRATVTDWDEVARLSGDAAEDLDGPELRVAVREGTVEEDDLTIRVYRDGDPELGGPNDCAALARSKLDDLADERTTTGEVEIAAQLVEPGPSYRVREFEDGPDRVAIGDEPENPLARRPTQRDPPQGSNALHLRGADSRSSVGFAHEAIEGLRSGGWSCWVRAPWSSLGPDEVRIFNADDTAGAAWRTYSNTDLKWFYSTTSGSYFVTAHPHGPPPDDEWLLMHYTWNYDAESDATTVRGGHDGNWKLSGTVDGRMIVPDLDPALGEWRNDYFEGDIDDFQLYRGTLSEAQLGRIMRGRAVGGLRVRYRFDRGGGQTARDASGNGYGGDITGGGWIGTDPIYLASESMSYQESFGSSSAKLSFEREDGLGGELAKLKGGQQSLERS